MNYLTLIFVAIAGFVLGRSSKLSFNPKQANNPYFAEASKGKLNDIQKEAREALSERTEKRKEKILEFMSIRQAQGEQGTCEPKPFTCNDVEKLLDVSESTAIRYLNVLEDEGKVRQVGESGRGVYYELVAS